MTTPPNAPEVDVLSVLDALADGYLRNEGTKHAFITCRTDTKPNDGTAVGNAFGSLRQARTAVAELLTREAALVAERDDADRRAGAAERRLAHELESSCKRGEWLSEAKRAAGYKNSASFDDVWAEALSAMKVVRGAPTDCDSRILLKPREIWACCHGYRREGHRGGIALYCSSQSEAEHEARDSDFPRTAVLFREVFVQDDFKEAGDADASRTEAGHV